MRGRKRGKNEDRKIQFVLQVFINFLNSRRVASIKSVYFLWVELKQQRISIDLIERLGFYWQFVCVCVRVVYKAHKLRSNSIRTGPLVEFYEYNVFHCYEYSVLSEPSILGCPNCGESAVYFLSNFVYSHKKKNSIKSVMIESG